MTDRAPFGVAYTSAVTRNRTTSHYATKTEAVKAAVALYREGAQNIQTFKYTQGIGAIDFDWRKTGRFHR